MEAIEAAAIGIELRPLLFEDLPDRLLGPLRVGVRFRPAQTFGEEPGVHLVIALEPSWRREKRSRRGRPGSRPGPSPSPTPACRRRLDEMMQAHLEKAEILLTILADEDRFHRRLHVVVDAATAAAPEKCGRPVVGVENSPASRADRCARTSCGCGRGGHARPSDRRHAVQHDDLMAPIELVGLARRERQRHIGVRRLARVRFAPGPGVTADRVSPPCSRALASLRKSGSGSVARAPALRRAPLTADPAPLSIFQLRARLHLALVRKRRLLRRRTLTYSGTASGHAQSL